LGWRFFRRVQILPGLRANLSKSGPSLSIGKRGWVTTLSRRGRRATVGIPGGGAPPGTAPVRFSPRAWPVAVAGVRRPRRAVAV